MSGLLLLRADSAAAPHEIRHDRLRKDNTPSSQKSSVEAVQKKSSLPTHIVIDYDFLESVSVVLLEQIRTIDKERLSDCLGRISVQDMQRVEAAMAVSLGMRWRHDR